jgi:Domain of unknown function (DUF6815)
VRVGLLWRGERRTGQGSERAEAMLGSLFDAFDKLNVVTERVVYADDAVEEVRDQLLGLDGVLVWVNPIQDGANRAQLDRLLRDVSAKGVWVSAHPDVIGKMGTKEVLYQTRSLGWGTDTDVYRSPQELGERLPSRLAHADRLVVKQARGNGGNGVWRVDLADAPVAGDSTARLDARVRVRQAQPSDAPVEEVKLGEFIRRLGEYFAWSGSLVVQPYQARLADGMIRCYFVQDQVAGFCHQWPRGLLDESAAQKLGAPRQRGPMEDPDTSAYRVLRLKAESEWVPGMRNLLGLEKQHMPVIWDADFLYGPKNEAGEDTHVLCEINISAVWPYPTQASERMAQATIAAIQLATPRREA